jgi:hypothetical protein
MELNDLSRRCHDIATANGWRHDDHRDLLWIATQLSNIHGEVSEAMEELRNHGGDIFEAPIYFEKDGDGNLKPCGFVTEIADVIIRCFDLLHSLYPTIKIDELIDGKCDYNETRGFRHGGKAL